MKFGTEYKSMISPASVDGRTVTGIAAVTGNVDYGGDVIQAGAFKKTLQERGQHVLHLWQHNQDLPPTAIISELGEVGRADLPADVQAEYPDATGGLMVKRTYLETPRADEILTGIKSGAIREMSIGYVPVKAKRSAGAAEGEPLRTITECKLLDTSDVNWGMNPATRARKSAVADLAMISSTGTELATLLLAAQQMSPADINQIVAAMMALAQLLNLMLTLGGSGAAVDDDDDGDSSDLILSVRRPIADLKALLKTATKAGRRNSAADTDRLNAIKDLLDRADGLLDELLGTDDAEDGGPDDDITAEPQNALTDNQEQDSEQLRRIIDAMEMDLRLMNL